MSITKEEYQNKEKEQLLKKQKKEYKEEEYCPLWILFFGFWSVHQMVEKIGSFNRQSVLVCFLFPRSL